MADVWCPFAVPRPGPTWKQGYTGVPAASPKTGVVFHSAEGDRIGIWAVIEGPRSASFQFAIHTSGTVKEFYPVFANCWHCGDRDRDDNVEVEGMLAGNLDLVGVEFEGRAGEPLTEEQYHMGLRLYRWLADVCDFDPPSRTGVWPQKTMWEHREVSGTSCPSGRIPWDRFLEDLEMTDEEKLELTLRRGAAKLQKLLADLEFQKVANLLAYIGVRAQG